MANSRRPFTTAIILGLVLLGLWVYRRQVHPPAYGVEEFSGSTMGTRYQVKIVGSLEPEQRQTVQDLLSATLKEVNEQMSTYLPESEISQFNKSTETGWFPVSMDFALVTALAKSIAEDSQGAFDPTVFPVVDAWGFGPKEGRQGPPAEVDLRRLREKIGMDRIDVRLEPPALRKEHRDIELDLSGIAKGHGVDRLAALLERLGYRNYMVEIGGEIRVLGANVSGAPWSLGIERPDVQGRSVQTLVRLDRGALATSGDYRNFREVDGKRRSHIIDPLTGHPIDHALMSVSVIGETCALADGWATALLVMGPERALEAANRLNLAAYLLVRSDDGIKELVSERFAPKILELGDLSQ